MERDQRSQRKRCVYCGRYFKPDYRLRKRQKSCKDKSCQAKRKKENQREWAEANPGYFRGRYHNTKDWRSKNPDYQRRWRAKRREIQDEISPSKPVLMLRLVIPDKFFKGELQDEIRLVRQCGCGFFVSGIGVQDTRLDCNARAP